MYYHGKFSAVFWQIPGLVSCTCCWGSWSSIISSASAISLEPLEILVWQFCRRCFRDNPQSHRQLQGRLCDEGTVFRVLTHGAEADVLSSWQGFCRWLYLPADEIMSGWRRFHIFIPKLLTHSMIALRYCWAFYLVCIPFKYCFYKHTLLWVYIDIHVYIHMCVCVCVFVIIIVFTILLNALLLVFLCIIISCQCLYVYLSISLSIESRRLANSFC